MSNLAQYIANADHGENYFPYVKEGFNIVNANISNMIATTLALKETEAASLKSSLKELDGLEQEALEDGLEVPEEMVVKKAKILVGHLHTILPVHFSAWPKSNGVVRISPETGGQRRAVFIDFDKFDRVHCIVLIDGRTRRAKYYSIEGLPDAFMVQSLTELVQGKLPPWHQRASQTTTLGETYSLPEKLISLNRPNIFEEFQTRNEIDSLRYLKLIKMDADIVSQ